MFVRAELEFSMRHHIRLGLIALPICLGAFVGCDKDDAVQHYDVPKVAEVPVSNEPAESPAPVADAGVPIHWTVPAGWTQLPGKEMRYASFIVAADHPDLQLTVVPLGGEGGSLLGNINRWEGQIGLPPSSDADLKNLLTPITVAGTHVIVFDRTGATPPDHSQPKRILAAIFPHADRTWFFKLAGPNDLVQSQKANFDTFVQSIRFDDAGGTPSPAPVADANLPIKFALPAGWQQEPASQASQFRVASFTVGTADDHAEAVVTHTVKDSGSMLDNINRWRGQVGLDPVDDAAKAPTEQWPTHDAPATVFNFDNTQSGRSMILAMITHGNEWWFFKLTGSSTAIAAQKANFHGFVTSIQFRSAAGE
jgi:hypothetical protein